jgi:hypothetical protein
MLKATYINPSTGKGWTPREEEIIAKIMSEEKMSESGNFPCSRPEAIRRMRRRRLDDLKGKTTNWVVPVLLSDRGTHYCMNQTTGRHRLPEDVRANTKYCDRACQQSAYRNRAA